jgi:ElaB/YqjD/DUF883 family membrane-anchored ribosome-binding protein
MTTKKGPITKATANAAEKADDVLADGVDAYNNAKKATVAQYDAARAKVTETADAAKSKVVETHENARVYVQENPEKSVAVSAGVGVLIGAMLALLLTRRR